MKFFPLIWKNLTRRKVRTTFTLLSLVAAFVLFSLLGAIRQALSLGIDVAGQDRLVMRHKVSIIQLLPQSYQGRILALQGVSDATAQTWFGGNYQDSDTFFAKIVVQPESFLRVYPEYVLSASERKSWLETRTGAVVGQQLAETFGWKVGDRIPIQADIWPTKTGNTWELDVVGIYEGSKEDVDDSQLFFRYDYFDEARRFGQGLVGWYVIRIANPDDSAKVAARLDATFANSESETKTEPEAAFVQGFANQVGNIAAIIGSIVGAVFFTILLVAGNTMAQSVRERTSELAVLKTLGFTNGGVMALVLAEALLLVVLGGGLGLLLGWLLVPVVGESLKGLLPVFRLPGRDVAVGAVIILLLALAAGALPALQAMRLRIVDALRRV